MLPGAPQPPSLAACDCHRRRCTLPVAAIVDVARRPWPPSSLLQAAAAAAGLSAVTIAESHRSTTRGYAVPMPPSCSALDMARRGSACCSFNFLVRRPVYVNSLNQTDFRFYPFRLHLHYESLSKHVGLELNEGVERWRDGSVELLPGGVMVAWRSFLVA
jgi:hypothetical protein